VKIALGGIIIKAIISNLLLVLMGSHRKRGRSLKSLTKGKEVKEHKGKRAEQKIFNHNSKMFP
jgi:hypothetical protein